MEEGGGVGLLWGVGGRGLGGDANLRPALRDSAGLAGRLALGLGEKDIEKGGFPRRPPKSLMGAEEEMKEEVQRHGGHRHGQRHKKAHT